MVARPQTFFGTDIGFKVKIKLALPSPKIMGKKTRKGSSEPDLFRGSPIFLSAGTGKGKGKALVGAKGATVSAKSTAVHSISLLTGQGTSTSAALTPSGSGVHAPLSIVPDPKGERSGSGAGSATGAKSANSRSKRTSAAAAASEFRKAPSSLTCPTGQAGQLDDAGDPPLAPSSTSGVVVPEQGGPRIRASVSPVSPSNVSGDQRMERLEQFMLLLMEDRAVRVSGSGLTASGSGIAPLGPGTSGSREGNTVSGSGPAGSEIGSGLAGSWSGISCSSPGISGSGSGNNRSGPGFAGSVSGLA